MYDYEPRPLGRARMAEGVTFAALPQTAIGHLQPVRPPLHVCRRTFSHASSPLTQAGFSRSLLHALFAILLRVVRFGVAGVRGLGDQTAA